MILGLNHIATRSPSTSTARNSSLTSSTLWLVGLRPVAGGSMRHQQLVACNLRIGVLKKGGFALLGKSQMLPIVQNWVPGGHCFT